MGKRGWLGLVGLCLAPASWAFSPPTGQVLTLLFSPSEKTPSWHCAQLPHSEFSLWYKPDGGWASLKKEKKRCDGTALVAYPVTPAPSFRDSDLTDFREIKGWPEWLCADFKDKRSASVWYEKAKGKATASYWNKRCDDWAREPGAVIED